MNFNKERKYYVYEWYIKETGEVFYVGKGSRYRHHQLADRPENFTEIVNNNVCEARIVKDKLTEEEAFDLEIETISKRRKEGHQLINIQDGGHKPPNLKGIPKSEEQKEKMRESMKRYYEMHPEKAKENSERLKKFLQTEAGKEFQQKSIKARDNDEFRKKLSEKCRAANRTPEYLERQSEIVKNMWKCEEYREMHSGKNNRRAQSVYQYDLDGNFIKEYDTIMQADRETGVNHSKISAVAGGDEKNSRRIYLEILKPERQFFKA